MFEAHVLTRHNGCAHGMCMGIGCINLQIPMTGCNLRFAVCVCNGLSVRRSVRPSLRQLFQSHVGRIISLSVHLCIWFVNFCSFCLSPHFSLSSLFCLSLICLSFRRYTYLFLCFFSNEWGYTAKTACWSASLLSLFIIVFFSLPFCLFVAQLFSSSACL